jgi:uncharacterized protein
MKRSRSLTRYLHRGFCASLLCAPAAIAAQKPQSASLPLDLPPLTEPASDEQHVGKVIWADLVTPDLEGAKRFYGGLLGWTFRELPGAPNYVLASVNNEPVAGLLQKALPPGESKHPLWLTFLAVHDVDAAQQLAVQNGGKVLAQSHNYPHRGRQAVLLDPDGAVFAVLAAEGGDPPDYLAAPGEWIWHSLLVADPKRESAFYKALFGYEVYDLSNEGDTHYILSSDSYARAGLNALPSDSLRRHPHWLNFVRVTNAADSAKKALALGGLVLVEPRVDRHGGQLAVLADPSGAPFGVMEWSDTDSEREPQ